MTDFCDVLKDAIDSAPDDETRADLQAIYDQACGVQPQGGPSTAPPPPKPPKNP